VKSASWLYHLLVFLHVTCAVGGPGALAYRSFVLDLARRRGTATAAGVLGVYGQISQVGEVLLYGVVVFGIGAVAAGGSGASFRKPWVGAALAVFVLMVGIVHGLVRPAERRCRSAMLELAAMPFVTPPDRPPQLAELDSLYRRMGAGMGAFNVSLLVALYLMTFKP
jgi:hypothetical protein